MIHGTPNNALAEISLALAMGFFSIMVLALVSMGGEMTKQAQSNSHNVAIEDSGAALNRSTPSQSASSHSTETQSVARNDLIIFYNGKYFDGHLRPVLPTSYDGRAHVVLAVDPALPISETLTARRKIHVKNLTIAPLDDSWRRALQEVKP